MTTPADTLFALWLEDDKEITIDGKTAHFAFDGVDDWVLFNDEYTLSRISLDMCTTQLREPHELRKGDYMDLFRFGNPPELLRLHWI